MSLLAGIVETWRRVAETSSRTTKVRALAEHLKTLDPKELEIGVLYLAGETPQGKFGIGYALLRDATSGLAPSVATLTLAEVDRRLTEIAGLRGAGSTERRGHALQELLRQATEQEREFLVRLLIGELRQGALAGVMLDAIATATGLTSAEVRRAAMYSGNLGKIASIAFAEGSVGLARFQLQLLSPVAPMLAQTATDVASALAMLGDKVAFEWKLDGARIQVHRMDDVIRIYTRNSNDVTVAVPEIVEAVASLPARELVLDGEAIVLRPDGTPQPFQVTMRRFGRKLDVQALRADLPLQAFFFDCLRLEGDDLVRRPAEERFKAMTEVLPITLRVPQLITASETEALAFYRDALTRGHEGVMAKALTAPYEAGNRGASWLKIKRAHTFDLVVLAAEWGHGRRTGWLSNLHLGAFDPVAGSFVMLGKTFKGLTDAMLKWQTEELLAREIGRDRWTVFVRPELVVEVAFNDLQASSQYPGGLALRFARVKRYRPDKLAVQADTIEAVRALYAA